MRWTEVGQPSKTIDARVPGGAPSGAAAGMVILAMRSPAVRALEARATRPRRRPWLRGCLATLVTVYGALASQEKAVLGHCRIHVDGQFALVDSSKGLLVFPILWLHPDLIDELPHAVLENASIVTVFHGRRLPKPLVIATRSDDRIHGNLCTTYSSRLEELCSVYRGSQGGDGWKVRTTWDDSSGMMHHVDTPGGPDEALRALTARHQEAVDMMLAALSSSADRSSVGQDPHGAEAGVPSWIEPASPSGPGSPQEVDQSTLSSGRVDGCDPARRTDGSTDDDPATGSWRIAILAAIIGLLAFVLFRVKSSS